MLAAVILSGGASSRMGSPKALLPYQGRPFLEHLLQITRHPKIGVRRVVLGAHAEAIAKAVPLLADELVINEEWEKGQLRSIHAALRSLPPHTDGMLLCLIDHPLISASLVNELIEASSMMALTSFSNSTGRTTMFSGTTLNRAEPTGTACAGMLVISMRRLSMAHWPINPAPNSIRAAWPLTLSSANADKSRRQRSSPASTW